MTSFDIYTVKNNTLGVSTKCLNNYLVWYNIVKFAKETVAEKANIPPSWHPKKFCVKANPKDKEWLAKQALFGIPS